jgi:beta-phosphoglucomutase-like phosphatase (HAD superfamily)
MKLRLAVATSSVSASARPFLDRTGVRNFFDIIVTGEEVQRGKPDPDIYLLVADKLLMAAGACLVIEDALSGVAAAKEANMRVAAIPDKRFVDASEYQNKADYVLGDLSEIPALIKRINAAAGKD